MDGSAFSIMWDPSLIKTNKATNKVCSSAWWEIQMQVCNMFMQQQETTKLNTFFFNVKSLCARHLPCLSLCLSPDRYDPWIPCLESKSSRAKNDKVINIVFYISTPHLQKHCSPSLLNITCIGQHDCVETSYALQNMYRIIYYYFILIESPSPY